MTRRALLLQTLGLGIAAALPPVRQRPQWLKDTGIVMAGNWEPLTFLRRRGGASAEELESWPLQRTEETARKLRESGVNLVVTSFFKGFGLKTEADDIEATRRFVGFAHRHGLRVGGYIGGSLMFETLFAEEEGAADWKQIDENGRPVYYVNPSQTFRYMACRNNPGYHAFVLRLLRMGVEDLKLDLIHFDQMESWTEPDVCRCRHCEAGFRAFLRERYTDDALRARFGFTRLADVAPPPMSRLIASGASELTNPLMQDWVRFRCTSYARRFAEYDAYLEKLNPEVALEGNPNLDGSLPKGMRNAVDAEQLLAHGDIAWSEEPQEASWTSDGRLVSKIRSFKMARRMGKSIFTYTGGSIHNDSPDSPPHLKIAEAMAFNGANLGMVGDVAPGGIALTAEARRMIRFFHDHHDALRDTEPVADVAVLRSFASVEFNPARGLVGAVLAEQSLIAARVPFEIISDGHLAGLKRYRTLVLADQDALGDDQLQAIRAFVHQGGGLVVTGNSSLLTADRSRRRKLGLADLVGREQPGGSVVAKLERGSGRVVYIPRIVPSVEPPAPTLNYRFDSKCWKLARNHAELVDAVEWASRGDFAVSVTAPAPVAIEVTHQRSTNRRFVHVVNYDFRHPAANIEISLRRIPDGAAVDGITWLAPDRQPQRLAGTVRDGTLRVRVPHLDVYGLLIVPSVKS